MRKLTLLLLLFTFLNCQKDDSTNTNTPTQNEAIYYCSKLVSTGSWQVYKKQFNSSVVETITNNNAFNYWWVEPSPDKTQLLLLRSPITSPKDQFDYENCEMIKCNADGSNPQIIIADNQYGWFAFGNPHWHPNGDRILLIAQSQNSSTPFYTYTVDSNGNTPEALTTQYSIDTNWSASGNQITFIGIDAGGYVDATSFEVFTADYNYTSNSISSIQQVTADATRNHDPCFSPDGSHIVFSASNVNLTDANLVTIETSGANPTTILDDTGIHGGPLNWGSNGKIYHHSIYIGSTNFTINAFDAATNIDETLLANPNFGYISPYYVHF